jgi:hypothetical protein
MKPYRTLAALGLAAGLFGTAHAGEVYGQLGFPGAGLGFAQPLNSHFTVRADYLTLGTHDDQYDEEGIRYEGTLKFARGGVFADWFPMAGSFRVTAGITANNMKLALTARGTNQPVEIGDTTYVLTPQDRIDAEVKFPSTTPYLGIGWGHHDAGTGLRFSFDLGAIIGKAKVRTSVSGPNANLVSQQDLDKETAELRDGVGKVKAIPQISFAIGYSF